MGFLTIDAGTTNLRVRYVDKKEIVACIKVDAGVRFTAIDGNNERLKKSLKDAISAVLKESKLKLSEVDAILASGMITSNLGLLEIPHLSAPVGMKELAEGVRIGVFPEIVEYPIHFVPGVKNGVGEADTELGLLDMMRGEEVEALGTGILKNMTEAFVFISPGSHTKFVFVDKNQCIQSCSTTLTGELLTAISGHTILSNSLSPELIQTIDPDYIELGIDAAKKYGLTKACFLVRVLDTLRDTTENERANFLAGALAYNDILSLMSQGTKYLRICIGGKQILRELYYCSLRVLGWKNEEIFMLNDMETEMVSSEFVVELYNCYLK